MVVRQKTASTFIPAWQVYTEEVNGVFHLLVDWLDIVEQKKKDDQAKEHKNIIDSNSNCKNMSRVTPLLTTSDQAVRIIRMPEVLLVTGYRRKISYVT
jgi:hypothetical protein